MAKLRQADRKLKQAEMLLNVSRRVAAIETLDEVLGTIVEMTTWELGAERGTLFLNDPVTDELYSRFAQGNFQREIRLLNNSGIAGNVFQTGEGLLIQDAYADKRFNLLYRGVDVSNAGGISFEQLLLFLHLNQVCFFLKFHIQVYFFQQKYRNPLLEITTQIQEHHFRKTDQGSFYLSSLGLTN